MLAAKRERAIAEKQALEAAKAAEIQRLHAEYREEREKRLEAEKKLKIVSRSSNTFSPSLLPPPPAHTPVDFTFKSPVGLPPPCNTPRCSTPPVFVHRWMSVSCQPARTQPGPAYTSDCIPAATTHTVHALSVEPVPTQSAFTGPTVTQPALTLAQHALLPPRPVMNKCTPTTPRPAMSVYTVHECAPAMPVHTMSECAPTMSRPVMLMHEYASLCLGLPCLSVHLLCLGLSCL